MTEMVETQWLALVRLAYLLLCDRATAEEAVQEALEATWRRRPHLANSDHLLTYVRTAVINRSRSAGRRQAVARRHLTLASPEHVPAADSELLSREDRRLVRNAVTKLSGRQREVVILRYWARLSEAEIAQTLDISTGTVKSTAHDALARLRANLRGKT
jgi:RNA polymerase sigma-70 factor (sigma-E family)